MTRKVHTLVNTGPYRWVRHPLYGAAVLAFLADSLVSANTFLFATGCATGCVAVQRFRFCIRKDKENPIARFGDEYRRYTQRTGRFLARR